MRRYPIANSRGVALPLAIFALVVIGILVGASFYIGRQEQTVGRNTVRLQQARPLMEAFSFRSPTGIRHSSTPWRSAIRSRSAGPYPVVGTAARSGA
jgi:hypothetical protein